MSLAAKEKDSRCAASTLGEAQAKRNNQLNFPTHHRFKLLSGLSRSR
jgi:hypothetical protein